MPRLQIHTFLALTALACESAAPVGTAASADAGSGDAQTYKPLLCIGPTPETAALSAQPGPTVTLPITVTPTIGMTPAQFALTDYQPLSCGYKATYGMAQFKGQVTVVALLAGW